MVKTPRRVSPPSSLGSNRHRWTTRFERIRAGSCKGDWATVACKRALSAALYKLAHGKCVFCESALEVSGDLEVEHYVAKTVNPQLAFEWSNLLPACRLCNRSKSNQDHQGVLLKPDEEDPEPFFWLHPGTGELQPHPALSPAEERRARETIRICNLQRGALCTKRLEMMRRVDRWLQLISVANPPSQPLIEEWQSLSDRSAEYKFIVRHRLVIHGQHQLAEEDRRLFEAGVT